MAEESLSQAELEALIRATDDVASPAADAPNASAGPRDLRRARRVDNGQLRVLAGLHADLAQRLAGALSAFLRSKADVRLAAVDEITFAEFQSGLQGPAGFAVVRAGPLEGRLVLAIEHAILYPMLDRMLGGGREPSPAMNRSLTQIEVRLAGRVIAVMLDELNKSWEEVVDLKPTVERIENNVQAARIAGAGEVVVTVRYELTLNEARGAMTLCIPATALEPIAPLLAARAKSGPIVGRPACSADGHGEADSIEVVVQLAEIKFAARELADLRVGDIIATDQDAASMVDVSVDGMQKFRGRLGAIKGRKAVRIEDAETSES